MRMQMQNIFRLLFFAGVTEIEQGKVTLKNMETGEQILVSPDDFN